MNKSRWLLTLLLAGPLSTASAATVLKCIDRNGNVTFTQTTCPPEQTMEEALEVQNPRPSGDGPSIPLAIPKPPEPEEEKPQQAASPGRNAPQAPDDEASDDGYDSDSYYDYPPPPYIHRPRPPYPDHTRPWPPYPPHPPYPPQPPQPPVQPPQPPKGVGAPRNATKHTGPQREREN
ncbi:DUF4124 domain-containing protein [Zestomonas carbonaria]|uniref:DUF4124 domain-containing protein n=1 Tax=Zestomonas carbonaria TaxID=2762745 RepID=A0A7U7I9S2_9GAMM|nr:DUF4124 domain-containing protein [Pseudomonas carbonaria]CAD5108714.1 hypothetical protein PSEWESI4_03006 [Pseudomonas carbonaria]